MYRVTMTVVLHELDQKNVTLAISTIWSITKMTVSTQKNNAFTHFCQNIAIGFVGLMSLGLSAYVFDPITNNKNLTSTITTPIADNRSASLKLPLDSQLLGVRS